MTLKQLLVLSTVLLGFTTVAQTTEFSFRQIQFRNNAQQWEKPTVIAPRKVRFSAENIDLKIDRIYHLAIVSKTHLPNNGIIFLCKDEKQKDVTVMLIDDDKMFVYTDTKRFQIDFDQTIASRENYYADAD